MECEENIAEEEGMEETVTTKVLSHDAGEEVSGIEGR